VRGRGTALSPIEQDPHLAQEQEYLGGAKSQMTALRTWITAHFPSFCVVVTQSLDNLSSACWDLVRSASRNILSVGGKEVSPLLA
jgi:hypothetical protein